MTSGNNGWGLGFDFSLAWKHGLKAAVTRISFLFFFYWVKPQPHLHPVITEGGSVIRAKAH